VECGPGIACTECEDGCPTCTKPDEPARTEDDGGGR